MKKTVFFAALMVFCAFGAHASTVKPIEKIGEGLSEMYYGVVEIPDNVNKTNTKGTPVCRDCTYKTNDDVGRGIARFVGGLVRVATFWCPDGGSEEPSQAVK